ncbi:MAG: anhydro-N-acetylmuramic acid kinase [Chitinophagales bacterium]
MSGSSLDGLDICYSLIEENGGIYSYKILVGSTVEFSSSLFYQLKNCAEISAQDLAILDLNFGRWMGEKCKTFIEKNNIEKLDFIASHGHTVFHFPKKGITKQIGCGQSLANVSGLRVINNFRERDVAAGGQGAPIVPICDLLFFPAIKYCLNLGGIMNISIKHDDRIISSDIGVCNQVINYFAQKTGNSFDLDGNIAKRGVIHSVLLGYLNSFSFFQINFPKSLDNGFSREIIALCEDSKHSIPDILRTFYEHIVLQICRFVKDAEKLLITGGGAHNIFLLELLKKRKLNLLTVDSHLIDYKEALAMSLMGVRFLENKFNVLASVTGAKENTICGNIYRPST